ncbi:MAG TPA: VWA domain-containing protein [Rhodothermales bacterium]
MVFLHPYWLVLLFAVVIAFTWLLLRRKRYEGLRYSDIRLTEGTPATFWSKLRLAPMGLRVGALSLAIVALARPQDPNTTRERFAEGVDIMLVLDTSTSMKAQDFRPNRFIAARDVASEFIAGRVSDRIGLTVFAALAFTQVPLTIDYPFLQEMLGQVEVGMIEDGTAIGTALLTAVNRLKDSTAKSKVVILLTDGQNNRGEIDPATAADAANAMKIRVYTIGVGAIGSAPFLADDPFYGQRMMQIPVEIDEEMLTSVAEKSGGKYFRATNAGALRAIYNEIGELEKTKIEERIYTDYEELFPYFLWPAFFLLMLEIILSTTRLRQQP